MAFGTIRLPLETLGVLSCFSGNARALGDFGFDAAAFAVVGRPFVEDAFDGDEKFREVGAGPLGEPANKALNHCQSFTF
jgi:hypothetical protein